MNFFSESESATSGLATALGKRFFLRTEDRALLATMEQGLEDVERLLLVEAKNADPVADAANRYLLEAGGKRVRPLLALLAAELGEGVNDEVIKAATAIELTHVATLYHDDVMDEADIRRGVPSAHRVWGNNIAILAGDILFARASQLSSTLGQRTILLQASTFERLCIGQMRETLGPQDEADPIEHYIDVLRDKTGSLIAAAGEIGLFLGGGSEEFAEPIRVYGESIGLAFQLVDDVIDLRSTGDESGKTPGTDLREGVPTLPLLLLEKRAADNEHDRLAFDRVREGIKRDETLPDALAELADHPATEQALATAYEYANRAKSALDVLPDSSARKALYRLADYVVKRSR